MKRIYLIICLSVVLVFASAFSQKPTIELTFTADNNGQPVALDSILIQNLTQGGDTTLYAPNNVLVLNYTLGMPDIDGAGKGTFTLSQNYPNPFEEETTIQLYLPDKDYLKLCVYNFLGQQVAFYEKALSEGQHSFTFYPGKEKYYLLTVTGNNATRAIKMVSLNSRGDDNCRIVFTGKEDNTVSYKSLKDINNFGFKLGDSLKYVGYIALGQAIITDSPTGNKSYEFQFAMNFPCPGVPTVTYAGQTYNTVQIGNQCWFKENLNIGTMIMGFFNQTDNSSIEKYCYGDNSDNCTTYGGLYQWDEMMLYDTIAGTQGICPVGWHLPTDEEWTTLNEFLGSEGVAGGKMKSIGTLEAGTSLWISPNTGATNESGFTTLPGAYRKFNGYFYALSYVAIFWSSSEGNSNEAWFRGLYYDGTNLGRDNGGKVGGFSVRCVKD